MVNGNVTVSGPYRTYVIVRYKPVQLSDKLGDLQLAALDRSQSALNEEASLQNNTKIYQTCCVK